MSLDLNKLANKLDEALANETSETLTKFLEANKMVISVEWIIKKLEEEELIFNHGLVERWKEQAKAMHKEEIKNAHQNGFYCGNDMANATKSEFISAEQYYKETYEK